MAVFLVWLASRIRFGHARSAGRRDRLDERRAAGVAAVRINPTCARRARNAHREDAPPAASEWRTAPLSSLGFLTTVGANSNLLHDGRAAGVLEAVLWHGGEASKVVDNFKALSKAGRDALIRFVNSL